MQKYLQSDKEFEIRFGVVMLLDHYLTEAYLERLFAVSESIHHEVILCEDGGMRLLPSVSSSSTMKSSGIYETAELDDFTL